jgi:hypothetical protein
MTEHEEEGVAPEALAFDLAAITDSMVAGEPVGPVRDGALAGLVETVARMREALGVAAPSPALAASLREQAVSALPAPSIAASERLRHVIGRLVAEKGFRGDFFAAPETTLAQAGIQLSSAEMAALMRLQADGLQEWMADLDERISKAGLPW